jgi:hypothetical protein
MNGGSINRCSRPGSLTAHTSISGGKSAAQVRKIPAPPPAYGKQNRRKRACGFGAAEVTQVSEDVVVVMRFAPIAICHAICPFPPCLLPSTGRHATCLRRMCTFPPGGGRAGWGGDVRYRGDAGVHPHPLPPPRRGRGSCRALRTRLVPNSIASSPQGGPL